MQRLLHSWPDTMEMAKQMILWYYLRLVKSVQLCSWKNLPSRPLSATSLAGEETGIALGARS